MESEGRDSAFLSNFSLLLCPSLSTNDREDGKKEASSGRPKFSHRLSKSLTEVNWLCTHWTGSVERRGRSLCGPPAAASACLPPPPARRHRRKKNQVEEFRGSAQLPGASQSAVLLKWAQLSAIHLEDVKTFNYPSLNNPDQHGKKTQESVTK